MDESFKERRKFPRIYRNFIVTYHEKGKSADIHDVSQINNLSQGGLSFSSTHRLAEGTLVVIDLKTPFISDSIRLQGVVLESKDKIEGLIYEIRLQFQEIPAEAVGVLEKIEAYGNDVSE